MSIPGTTIIFQEFLGEDARVDVFAKGANEIRKVGGEAMLLELGLERSLGIDFQNPVEHAALQNSWRNGYFECLKDIFRFQERYVGTPDEEGNRRPDFGANDELYTAGEITGEEYEQLTGYKPTHLRSPKA